MTYSPHFPADHAGGAVTGCAFCRDYADDTLRRLIGAPARRWFVSAIYGRSKRLVAGPFDSAGDAIAAVPGAITAVARDFASDPRVHFAGYGVSSSLADHPTVYSTDLDRRIAA